MHLLQVLLICILWCFVVSKEIAHLQGLNFELALSSYKYIAILFFDNSEQGNRLESEWTKAAESISSLPHDCEIAKISGNDPDLSEIITSYGITVPSIRVFRRGIMSDYRGSLDSEGMANYVMDDAQPSVRKKLTTIKDMKNVLEKSSSAIVFGLFDVDDIQESDAVEGYSIDPWGQFQAAADSLRGHATFYLVNSDEIFTSFKLSRDDLPVVFMVSNEGEGFLRYSGEILEINLSEWVLRNSSPTMDELTVATPTVLSLTGNQHGEYSIASEMIAKWSDLSEKYKGKAIFSYMALNAVADVVEYFDVDLDKDVPMIAAHQPSTDNKFKSSKLNPSSAEFFESMETFVQGVIAGKVPKVLKSEPVPPVDASSPVLTAVATNLFDIVSKPGVDVMVIVYTPWCAQCRKIMPTYEILGKAVQAEPLISIVKINANANDVPSFWGIKSYPTIFWFPSRDKPYNSEDGPVPRSYWDAGYSLHELVGFVQREGSFDPKQLKIATSEQLGSLLADEESVRAKYIAEERLYRRNEGRKQLESSTMDYLFGEVVYDGLRWHWALVVVLILFLLVSVIGNVFLILNVSSGGGQNTGGTGSKGGNKSSAAGSKTTKKKV